MRFLNRALGVLALSLLMATPSLAASMGYTYNWKQVTFCTNCGDAGYDGATETDSLKISVANAADVQDTSVFIPTPGLVFPAVDDSFPQFILRVQKSAAGAAGDTLYALVQPSVNGVTYTEPTWLVGYAVVAGAVRGGAQFYFPDGSFAVSSNWINVAPRFCTGVRVRLYWDGTAATSNGGTVTVSLGYLVNAGTRGVLD